GNDIASDGVNEIGVPDEIDRARNMTALVDAGNDAHFDHADIRIIEIFFKPIGRDQRFGQLLSGGDACEGHRRDQRENQQNGKQRSLQLHERVSSVVSARCFVAMQSGSTKTGAIDSTKATTTYVHPALLPGVTNG